MMGITSEDPILLEGAFQEQVETKLSDNFIVEHHSID